MALDSVFYPIDECEAHSGKRIASLINAARVQAINSHTLIPNGIAGCEMSDWDESCGPAGSSSPWTFDTTLGDSDCTV